MRAAENLSDLIAKPPEKYDPEPRYISKYHQKIINAEKRDKSAHKTLGVASVELDSPLEYLKKGTGITLRRPPVHHKHYQRPGYQRTLPKWQPIKASEIDKQISGSQIDFMKRNFEEAMNLRPVKARKYYVDDRYGNAQPLRTSGMYPLYRNRKDYGQVPGSIAQPMGDRAANPRQKTVGHPRGADKSKTRPRQKTTSPQRERPRQRTTGPRREDKVRERPRQKTMSPRRENKLRDRSKQKTTSPQREDKLRETPRQKTMSPQGEDKLRERLRQNAMGPESNDELRERPRQNSTGPQGQDTLRGRPRQRSTSRHVEDESSGSSRKKSSSLVEVELNTQQKGDKENGNEDEKSMIDIKSFKGNNDVKEARIHPSVDLNENEDKQSMRSSQVNQQQPRCRYVTEDERAELLYGMKKKWDETMKTFQCLPFLTDTQPKAKRKSAMEKDLLQLEKDIEIIEHHPYIYVYSDDEAD